MEKTSLKPHFADTHVPTGITENSGRAVAYSRIDVLARLPTYSMLTGNSQSITPYHIRVPIPAYAHWVPIAGMRHEKALECTDLFIRSHIWHVMRNRRTEWTDDQCRKIGFILGVARAVCCDKFPISAERLISDETATPVMSVSFGEDDNATPTSRCLVEDPRTAAEGKLAVTDPRTILMQAFQMTPDEKAVLPALVKSAHAIIPLQGFGLITDGHEYLSDKGKAVNKAFRAVERQHWVGDRVPAYMEDDQLDVRDILWHKAGYPVSIEVKQFAATSQLVADNLRAADLESAACRLPAVESEVRAISTYLQVTDAVRSSMESYGCKVDNTVLRQVNAALAHFPLAVLDDYPGYKAPEPMVLGAVEKADGTRSAAVRVSNRKDVLAFAKNLISRSQSTVAICFGYYMAMLDDEATAATGGQVERNSLANAFSLRRLRTECIGAFYEGTERYKDMLSVKAKARREGTPKTISNHDTVR